MVFCVIIMCLGVIGNIMVPIVILKTKDMRNSTNIFLINLSVADLLVLLVCTPTVLVEVNTAPETWVLGHHMCKLVPFIELTVAHASVLTILAISFERYYAICEPLKAGYVCTKARALLICIICWFIAGLFTSPILEIASFRYEKYYDGSSVPVCFTTVDTFWPSFFFVGSISIFFFIPLVVLIVLYSVIAKHLMVSPTLISAQGNRSNFIKYRKQVILMLATVVISFFTCLLPFRAFTLWIIFVPTETIIRLLSTQRGIDIYYSLLYLCRCMLYLNSAMNPILYNLMSSKFREGFIKLLGCRPLIRTTSWSDSARKGTFHTTSTNLSSSNPGHNNATVTTNVLENQRIKDGKLCASHKSKSLECTPGDIIKYVTIVTVPSMVKKDITVPAIAEHFDDNESDSDVKCVMKGNNKKGKKLEISSPDNSKQFLVKSYQTKQKSNYDSLENVKFSISQHSSRRNDECLPEFNEEIDSKTSPENEFCINIYNLLSAKESLV